MTPGSQDCPIDGLPMKQVDDDLWRCPDGHVWSADELADVIADSVDIADDDA